MPPWITVPLTVEFSPDNPRSELLFEYLDRKTVREGVYLVIYIYEFASDCRELTAACLVDLPGCKTAAAFRRKTTKVNVRSSVCSWNLFAYGFHDRVAIRDTRCLKCIRSAPPDFTVEFTPFFGSITAFREATRFRGYRSVLPVAIPMVMPPSFCRSIVCVAISGINQNSSRKRSRLIIRLLDHAQRMFVPIIENFLTGKSDSAAWISACFRGARGEYVMLNEAFTIDLLDIKTTLRNLYVTVEVQRLGFGDNAAKSSSYAVIPLATPIGAVRESALVAPLNHFPESVVVPGPTDFLVPDSPCERGRVCGELSCSLSFSSTMLTAGASLHKLLCYTENLSDLEDVLQTFYQGGIAEWCTFFKRLALNLTLIMANCPAHRAAAFDGLLHILSEVLSRAAAGYLPQIDEFLTEHFSPECPTMHHATLMYLHEALLPLIVAKISVDDTTLPFRNTVQCSPHLFELVTRSLQIHQSFESVNLQPVIADCRLFVDRVVQLVHEVPRDSQVMRKGFVFTNQQLIIQNFAAIVSALQRALPLTEIAPFTVAFLSAVRHVADDRKQVPIDKAKLKCMLSIAATPIWLHVDARSVLLPVYITELRRLMPVAHCREQIIQVIAAIFRARDRFILDFIPELELWHTTCPTPATSRFLLMIVYTFPAEFPPGLGVRVLRSPHVEPQERLFAFSHIFARDEGALQSDGGGIELVETFLELSFQTATRVLPSQLDRDLAALIYPAVPGAETALRLFRRVPRSQRLSPSIVRPIMHCYLLRGEAQLREIFTEIATVDTEFHGEPHVIIVPALQALWEMSESPRLAILADLFEIDDPRMEYTALLLGSVVRSLRDIRALEFAARNADQLNDSLNSVFRVCQEYGASEVIAPLLLKLVELHKLCGNHLEAARSALTLLAYIPCGYDPLPATMIGEEHATALSFHTAKLMDCLGLFEAAGYHELALETIDYMVESIVKPFKYDDVMPALRKREAKLLETIATSERVYSSYFFVAFYGAGFDRYYRNRVLVYRRSPMEFEQFKEELSAQFDGLAIIAADPPTEEQADGNGQFIQALPLVPAFEGELDDPFYSPNSGTLRYHVEFALHRSPSMFRFERLYIIEKGNAQFLNQTYFFTSEPFPSTSYRLEIEPERTVVRNLSVLESSIVMTRRLNLDIALDIRYFRNFMKGPELPVADRVVKFTEALSEALEIAQTNGIRSYASQFMDSVYAKRHPDHVPLVGLLAEAVKEQLFLLGEALSVNDRFVPAELRNAHDAASQSYDELVAALGPQGSV
jgi:hypothetical protein